MEIHRKVTISIVHVYIWITNNALIMHHKKHAGSASRLGNPSRRLRYATRKLSSPYPDAEHEYIVWTVSAAVP